MTALELAKRDLKKAQTNLDLAKKRPNTPKDQLEHLEELYRLRKEIVERMTEK
jgi:hypothetical protein